MHTHARSTPNQVLPFEGSSQWFCPERGQRATDPADMQAPLPVLELALHQLRAGLSARPLASGPPRHFRPEKYRPSPAAHTAGRSPGSCIPRKTRPLHGHRGALHRAHQ